MLISMSSDSNNYNQNWGNFNYFTYALLKPGSSRQAFQKKVDQTEEKYVKPVFDPFGVKMRFYAQPIVDIHLNSDLEREPEELGSMSYIWTFSAVAFFMLLIACINYMNLTTADQVCAKSKRNRHPESDRFGAGTTDRTVSGRIRTYGDGRRGAQFHIDHIIIFRFQFDLRKIVFHDMTLLQPSNIFLMLGIGLFTGLIGGSYPAFSLSAFQPVSDA